MANKPVVKLRVNMITRHHTKTGEKRTGAMGAAINFEEEEDKVLLPPTTTLINHAAKFIDRGVSSSEGKSICALRDENCGSDSGAPFCYGDLCERHTYMVKGARPVNDKGKIRLAPVNEKNCEPIPMITSTIVADTTEDVLFRGVNLSTDNSVHTNNIKKRYSMWLRDHTKIDTSDTVTSYLNTLTGKLQQLYSSIIAIQKPELEKLRVFQCFSMDDFAQNYRNNLLYPIAQAFATMEKNTGGATFPDGSEFTYDETYIFTYIPILKYNVIDIMNILSYGFAVSADVVQLRSNCFISNNKVLHGVPRIYHGLSTYIQNIRTEGRFDEEKYSIGVKRGLREKNIPSVAHIEYLMMPFTVRGTEKIKDIYMPVCEYDPIYCEDDANVANEASRTNNYY